MTVRIDTFCLIVFAFIDVNGDAKTFQSRKRGNEQLGNLEVWREDKLRWQGIEHARGRSGGDLKWFVFHRHAKDMNV